MPIPDSKKIAIEKRNAEIVKQHTDQKVDIPDLAIKYSLSEVFVSGILTKAGVKKRKRPTKKA